jgi:hypothetical protein
MDKKVAGYDFEIDPEPEDALAQKLLDAWFAIRKGTSFMLKVDEESVANVHATQAAKRLSEKSISGEER